jgi:large subunit ribosomal protein L23
MAEKKTTTEKAESQKPKAESTLIIAPRVTEKASMQSTANAYTFVVAKNANKMTLAKEIKAKYKVTPIKINITTIPRQYTFVRGRLGTTAGIKKAVVFLKKGDTIALG